MRLEELAVRPLDGSAFVEGTLGIWSASGETVKASSPGELVGVACRRSGSGRAAFHLYEQIVRAPDGFHEAGPPVLVVELGDSVPDLFDLLRMGSKSARLRIGADGARLVSVRWKAPEDHERGHSDLYADGHDLDLRVSVEEGGVRIAFEGEVGPAIFLPEQSLPFEKASVRCDLLLPAAWCRLQGLFMPISFPRGDETAVGPWAPSGPGLGSIALDSWGSLYCPGMIDWRERNNWSFTGPFVRLHLRGRELVAVPVREPKRLANGFASADRGWPDGPEMMLSAGFEDWARMLGNRDEAEIALTGAGIGHVDGQTGRSVGECGGHMRQPISRLRLGLKRSREGLLVRGEGALEPLDPDPGGRSLGPDLSFEFLIPRAWILARGLPIQGFRDDRKKEFPGAETW